jgi:putative transposase
VPPIKHVRGIAKKPISRDDADRGNFVERVADVLDMSVESVWERNRRPQIVRARDLLCFWGASELGISATDLAIKLGLTQPAISMAIRRGEKIARRHGFKLLDK